MALIGTLRTQLHNLIATNVAGLNAYEFWEDVTHLPAAIVVPKGGDYEQGFGADRTRYRFDIHVLASAASGLRDAQAQLDGYMSNTGTSSIRVALATDRGLGGNAHGVFIRRFDLDEDIVTVNGVPALRAVVSVEVDAS